MNCYLFTLVLDVITEHIQYPVLQCVIFANDIVLVGESRQELNRKLTLWRQVLKAYGFHISRLKMKYMKCKLSERRTNYNLKVKIRDDTTPQVMTKI